MLHQHPTPLHHLQPPPGLDFNNSEDYQASALLWFALLYSALIFWSRLTLPIIALVSYYLFLTPAAALFPLPPCCRHPIPKAHLGMAPSPLEGIPALPSHTSLLLELEHPHLANLTHHLRIPSRYSLVTSHLLVILPCDLFPAASKFGKFGLRCRIIRFTTPLLPASALQAHPLLHI